MAPLYMEKVSKKDDKTQSSGVLWLLTAETLLKAAAQ